MEANALRHPLPMAAWPESDRALWTALWQPALRPLERPGGGAHWSPRSRRMIETAYGQWLTWLQHTEPTCLGSEEPLARITRARLLAFIRMLQDTVSSHTALLRVFALRRIAMASDRRRDWDFFRPIVSWLWRIRRPVRDKAALIVPARDLDELGWALMRESEASEGTAVQRAVLFRDGIMIALLISLPLRNGNFSALRLGHSLRDEGDGFIVRIPASEAKGGRPLTDAVRPALVEPLRQYIAEHRPQLLKGKPSEHLWITYQSRPMSIRRVHDIIATRTRAAFGHAICPHLFRDCAASSIAEVAPSEMRIASQLLGHAGIAMTERHYNHAGSASVLRRHQQAVLRERQLASESAATERAAMDDAKQPRRRIRAPRQLGLRFDTLDSHGYGQPIRRPTPRTGGKAR